MILDSNLLAVRQLSEDLWASKYVRLEDRATTGKCGHLKISDHVDDSRKIEFCPSQKIALGRANNIDGRARAQLETQLQVQLNIANNHLLDLPWQWSQAMLSTCCLSLIRMTILLKYATTYFLLSTSTWRKAGNFCASAMNCANKM